MPIADITNKILADASKKAEGILKDAEIKVFEISNATKILKENTEKDYIKKTESMLVENERRVVSVAKQEVKLIIDTEKRKAVDTMFEDALKQLLSLSGKEYEEIILSLMNEIPKNTDGKIITPKEKEEETENALKKVGLKYSIKTTNKFKGGFIFWGENFESNFVFEEIIKNKKSFLEVEVAHLLFS